MSVIVLLICVFVQRYLRFLSAPYHKDWVLPYYSLCYQRFSQPMASIPMLGLSLLVIPPLLLMILLFTVVEHLVGGIGYWVLTLVWCWYCLDMLDTSSVDDIPSARNLAKAYFHHVFAVIFWFLLGPLWLALYVIVSQVSRFGERQEDALKLFSLSNQLLAIMDWVPVRLFGLSLALISHFTKVLKLLLSTLHYSFSRSGELLADWVEAALTTLDESMSLSDRLTMLLEYSLIVWLVIAIILGIATLF